MGFHEKLLKARRVGIDKIALFVLLKFGFKRNFIFPTFAKWRRLLHPFSYANRLSKVSDLVSDIPSNLIVDHKKGYFHVENDSIPGIEELRVYCDKMFNLKKGALIAYNRKEGTASKRDKQFYGEIFSLDNQGKMKDFLDIEEIRPVVEFATSKTMVQIASKYLGERPLLGEINLLNSVVNDLTTQSHLYHLDGIKHNRIKLFLAIQDVDLGTGPFTFLDSTDSDLVLSNMNYQCGRLSDEEVYAYVSPDKANKLIGPAGSALIIDTSKCLHYGSRCRKKDRLVLEIHYTSRFNPFGVGDSQFSKKIRKKDLATFKDPYIILT